jgi:electron transfer flavoprotein alpha subunit
MDFAVLVKVVPPLEGMRYDPARRTVVREGTELFLNPFDQRALRVALDLRRPGERVTVLSLGPPEARTPLRDARALGADRVVLLSDPRCAGSDTLATSRALVAGLALVGHDVVLAGTWTTDSETGQVGPEVAELLDVPALTGARTIARDESGPGLAVTVDTATGWAAYRASAPLLVTVGEKITKPGKVSAEERARLPESSVEVLSLDDLALPPTSVGFAGSPTTVSSVREVAPNRVPVVFGDGSPAERVDRAVTALRSLLARRPETVRERPAPPRNPLEDREVLVLATAPDGAVDRGSLGSVAEVRRALPGYWPSAVWVGRRPSAAETALLGHHGVAHGYFVPVAPAPADPRGTARAFARVLDHRPRAAAAIFPSDPFGREAAGRLAAARSLGLTGDAVQVEVAPSGGLVWTKPSFGGRTLAGIWSRTSPSLATVRPGVWEPEAPQGLHDDIVWTEYPGVDSPPGPVREAAGTEVGVELPAMDRPDVVVAVGMGVGGPAGVEAVAPWVRRWGAALGATRKVVDAGWVPRQLQVGLTGRSPAPRLGVLLGVGGSANHLVGWRRAGVLLAVNRDPEAPVFHDVDVGIVGALDEVLPELGEPLARLLGR